MTEPLKPRVSVGYGTGNPAAAPNYRPLNPWGRRMPPAERAPRPELWQIIVTDRRDRKQVRVGPQMTKECLSSLFHAIRTEIVSGRETRWSEPMLVPMSAPALLA